MHCMTNVADADALTDHLTANCEHGATFFGTSSSAAASVCGGCTAAAAAAAAAHSSGRASRSHVSFSGRCASALWPLLLSQGRCCGDAGCCRCCFVPARHACQMLSPSLEVSNGADGSQMHINNISDAKFAASGSCRAAHASVWSGVQDPAIGIIVTSLHIARKHTIQFLFGHLSGVCLQHPAARLDHISCRGLVCASSPR